MKKYIKTWNKVLVPASKREDDGQFNLGIILEPDPDCEDRVYPDGVSFEDMGRRIRCYDLMKGQIANYRADSIRKCWDLEYWLEKLRNTEKK